ncbi:MAG: vitamin B12-dependent ribonucleotide reductase [Planctomycetes bacterium]|nr:vitamin B12-dependent ribonucleotide reductase [Planctomycetota bacterium]
MIQPAKSLDSKGAASENKVVKDRKEQFEATRTSPVADQTLDPVTANGKALGLSENCIRVLRTRYLKKDEDGKPIEVPEELFRRVARVVAEGERAYGASDEQIAEVENQFYKMMVKGEFMPNSPTLMNAGREMGMLSACFVLPVGDSIDEIFDTVKATALIQKAGGGTGFAFDRLRPTGDFIKSSGGTTSGPISFWRVLSEATNAIQQGAFRRGANMGMMNITHPDILKFIEAKQDLTQFTNYNISVKVSDNWMEAYRKDNNGPHVVINPRTKKRFVLPKNLSIGKYQVADLVEIEAYEALPEEKRPDVWRMGEIYDSIVNHAWQTGEPGVVFIDRINQANPTPHIGEMEATNPCGEQPLLPFEACNLGSINLGLYVHTDSGRPAVDWDGLRKAVRLSTQFLDNIIDVNKYPLPQITHVCHNNRKIGLGVMGFADALYKLGVAYNSDEGVVWGERFMKFLNDESHQMSQELAEQRGNFGHWPGSTWDTVHHRKMRNACCTTVAPTGTISIIANCSGGVEPLFSLAFFRQVMRDHTGKAQHMVEVNPIFLKVAKERGFYSEKLMDRIATEGTLAHIDEVPEDVKKTFVCAHDITPEWHIRMQAAFQRHCDASISKTTNFPESAKPEDVRAIYTLAFDLGCKGVTVYRDGCRKGQPMALKNSDKKDASASATTVAVKAVAEAAKAAAVPSPTRPAKTPAILSAVRIRQNTPFGHMHVSITVDPKVERELEVFAQLGKAGDVAMSDLEAICRMVSLFLRCGGSLDQVIDQLEGIGSHLSIPTRDGRVMSLGDALGKTLRKYQEAKREYGLKSILLGEIDFEAPPKAYASGSGSSTAKTADSPPGVVIEAKVQTAADKLLQQYKLKCPECKNGTLSFMEGCVKCPGCGFSQC